MVKFVLASYEKYTSTMKDFQVWGSAKYPTDKWDHLSNFTAKATRQEQEFELRAAVRYLKFKFYTHYEDEHFCTLSQIRCVACAPEFLRAGTGGRARGV